MPSHLQDEVQQHSLSDPETFWKHQAEQLQWHTQPSKAFNKTTKKLKNGTSHDHWEWFPGGEISTCYNAVDRHVEAGNGDNVAILWDSPVTKTKERYTYKQLQTEVEVFAGVLRDEGVKKGDVVLIYSPFPSHPSHFHLLTVFSAHDTSGANCYSGHLSTRSHTRCRLWWFCCGIFNPAHRSIATCRRSYCLLWY